MEGAVVQKPARYLFNFCSDTGHKSARDAMRLGLEVLSQADRCGVWLYCHCRKDNTRLRAVYERFGFVPDNKTKAGNRSVILIRSPRKS
jgi:hypothetical protein